MTMLSCYLLQIALFGQKEQRKIVEIILENSANIAFLCSKTLDKIVEIFFWVTSPKW